MSAFSLAKKSFFKPFDKGLILMIAPAYLILVGSTTFANYISNYQTDLPPQFGSIFLLFLGSQLYFPILITGLHSNEANLKFKLPPINLILKKSWRIFIAGIIPTIFIILGTLCLIVPGIFLAKRYVYVALVTEKEMIGSLEAMRKSRALSQRNGWSVLLGSIYCAIPYVILSLPITLLVDPNINTSVPIALGAFVAAILGWFSTVSTNSVAFLVYLNGEESNG